MMSVSNLPHYSDDEKTKHDPQSPHRELYKKRVVLSQEERRRRTLEEQKKRRNELFDHNRGLVFDEDDDCESLVEDMEVSRSPLKKRPRGRISKMLMFSEWFSEIPEDMHQSWYFVPSPVGRRCIVIANKGVTKMFSKWGKFLKRFQSALPSGCRGEYKFGPTILDCIWSEQNSICYVLDAIVWKGQSFNDCEAEFRFYWLKTKFEETPELQTITDVNQCQLQVLPSAPFSPSDLACELGINSVWATPNRLDGILFYHKHGHYYSGEVTPLVGWLKPFMLQEVLGIEVPDVYLQDCPEDYISMEKYIAAQRAKEKQHHKRANNMEVEEVSVVEEESMEDGGNVQGELESVACMKSTSHCEADEET